MSQWKAPKEMSSNVFFCLNNKQQSKDIRPKMMREVNNSYIRDCGAEKCLALSFNVKLKYIANRNKQGICGGISSSMEYLTFVDQGSISNHRNAFLIQNKQ